MVITGPTQANVAPEPPPPPPPPAPVLVPTVTVFTIVFDMVRRTYTAFYGSSTAATRQLSGATPASLLAELEAGAQGIVEADQGWAPGSSQITTP